MRNIILIAPPAAGKGTQSKMICEKYQIPHISTGDLLRDEAKKETKLGKLIQDKMNNGELVTDEIVIELLKNRIKKPDCSNGYVLDGFPRNISQAEKYLEILEEFNLPLGDVIYLELPKEIAKKRIVGRLSCTNCGAVYNDQFEESKPKNLEACDLCNNTLSKREDDNEEVFDKRYDTYVLETKPLIDFFDEKGLLSKIDSSVSIESAFNEIEKIINRGNLWLKQKKKLNLCE